MRYDLVIFDNDGVLVDSERIANRVLAAYLTELSHPTTFDDAVRDYMGGAIHRVHDLVFERSGRRLPREFDETLHHRTFEAFRKELSAVDGVESALDELGEAGVPYCVASSGSHERIRVSLHTTGLDGRFDDGRIFSSQDVGRGKPAPDLFLHAAAVMGVSPGHVAVVEDSPLGIRAAGEAGMDVYAYGAMTTRARLEEANAVFCDMSELMGLLSG